MAEQAPWVELIRPSCFRESCEVGHVVRDSAPTHLKSLASMLKVNGTDCESPQGLGGGRENLTSNQEAQFSLDLYTFKRFYAIPPSEESCKQLSVGSAFAYWGS